MKAMEDLKEMLEDELKKITKKGDITPQELESAYKAVDILKDLETIKAMQGASEGGQSQRGGQGGNSYNSYRGSYGPVWNQDMIPYSMEHSMRGGDNSNRGSYDGSYDGSYNSYDGNSNAGRRGRDGDGDGQYSEEGSYRRGRNMRTGRYMSRDGSYDYSRHTEKERMIEKLEDMMDDTSSEKIKRAIGQCLEKLEG